MYALQRTYTHTITHDIWRSKNISEESQSVYVEVLHVVKSTSKKYIKTNIVG